MPRHRRLTDASIKALIREFDGPNGAALHPQTELTDPGLKGLQLRITGEARTWFLRYVFGKRRHRVPLGAYPSLGLAEAREQAIRAKDHIKRGINPRNAGLSVLQRDPEPAAKQTPSKPHSVEALAEDFMTLFIPQNRKDPGAVQRVLKKDVLPVWRGRDARTITPRDVINLLDGIVARGSPVMANRTADILAQMFMFGIHRTIVDDTPVKLLIPPGGKEKPRQRTLTDKELGILLINAVDVFKSPPLRRALMLQLLTLQRRGELMLARWADIDMENKTWNIPQENAKTEQAITVPLSDWAVSEFKGLKNLAGRFKWVFPDSTGKKPADPKLLTRSVARCQNRLKALGIAKFTGHDLRRTGRSGLSRLGIEQHIAERVLNHSSGSKIERTYNTHDFLDERRVALDKWAAHLTSLK